MDRPRYGEGKALIEGEDAAARRSSHRLGEGERSPQGGGDRGFALRGVGRDCKGGREDGSERRDKAGMHSSPQRGWSDGWRDFSQHASVRTPRQEARRQDLLQPERGYRKGSEVRGLRQGGDRTTEVDGEGLRTRPQSHDRGDKKGERGPLD